MRSLAGRCALLIALLLVGGCSSGKKYVLTDVWRNKSYKGPFEDALIIGMAREDEVRRRFEDGIVQEFRARGVGAVASHEVLPPGEDIEKEKVKASIEGRGIDVVLVARLVGTESDRDVVRGPTWDVPSRYDDNLYGYYFWTATNVRDAPYYKDYTVAQLEANIYEVATEKLVWTAMSEMFDPKSTDEVIYKLSREILASLYEEGWIDRSGTTR